MQPHITSWKKISRAVIRMRLAGHGTSLGHLWFFFSLTFSVTFYRARHWLYMWKSFTSPYQYYPDCRNSLMSLMGLKRMTLQAAHYESQFYFTVRSPLAEPKEKVRWCTVVQRDKGCIVLEGPLTLTESLFYTKLWSLSWSNQVVFVFLSLTKPQLFHNLNCIFLLLQLRQKMPDMAPNTLISF